MTMKINFKKLKENWNSLEIDSMKRVDSKHNLDFYIINNQGKKALMLEGSGNKRYIQSSKSVYVKIQKHNEKYRFYIQLEDKNKEEMFINICLYLIRTSYDFMLNDGFDKVVNEYIKMKKFLTSSNSSKLSELEVKGLLAELYLLKYDMKSRYNITTILESWFGPDKEQQDFIFQNEWYEVKTTSETAKVIKISSIHQLDNRDVGYLVHIVFKKTTKIDEKAISLNKFISNINKDLTDNQSDVFNNKIIQTGYFPSEDYDEYCYRVKEVTYYIVDKNFPKIRRVDLPEGVDNCIYDININRIEKYKVEK